MAARSDRLFGIKGRAHGHESTVRGYLLSWFHNILKRLLPIYEPQSRANYAQLCATPEKLADSGRIGSTISPCEWTLDPRILQSLSAHERAEFPTPYSSR